MIRHKFDLLQTKNWVTLFLPMAKDKTKAMTSSYSYHIKNDFLTNNIMVNFKSKYQHFDDRSQISSLFHVTLVTLTAAQ